MIDFLRIAPLVLSFLFNIIILIGLLEGLVKTTHLKAGRKVKNFAIFFVFQFLVLNIWSAYYGLKALVHIGFIE